MGSETPRGYLDEHLGAVANELGSRCETPPPETTSANEADGAHTSVNGGDNITTPPSLKKKRPYVRKSVPKGEAGPVVKLMKLSPNTIARHTNGEVKTVLPVSPLAAPVSLSSKRRVNGPGFTRSKQGVKKKAVKSKEAYRNSLVRNRGNSELGITPLDSTKEGKVECVKCSTVVNIASARQHLTVCTGQMPQEVIEQPIPAVVPLGPPPSPKSPIKGSRGSYGTRASSIRSVQSTYGADACGLCGARGLSDGVSRYLHAHVHHQRYACLVCGSMHARVSALVKHLQAAHGKDDA